MSWAALLFVVPVAVALESLVRLQYGLQWHGSAVLRVDQQLSTAGLSMAFFVSGFFGFLLKSVAIVAGAAFGILGLGSKVRDDSNKLTAKGKLALFGLVFMALLALVAQTLEYWRAQQAAAESALRTAEDLRRSQALLSSVLRGVFPMRGVSVDFSIVLPRGNIALDQLRATLKEAGQGQRKCGLLPKGLLCAVRSERGEVIGYRVERDSPFFPRPGSDAFNILRTQQIFVAFYSRDTNDEYHRAGSFRVEWDREDQMKGARLIYLVTDDSLQLEMEGLPVDDAELRRSGVLALSDLFPGGISASTMTFDDELCEPYNEVVCDRLTQSLEKTQLMSLELRFPFPKKIGMWGDHWVCDRVDDDGAKIDITLELKGLSRPLPDTIEEVDFLGNFKYRAEARYGPPTCR